MSEFKGKVLLVVNVATKCGYTSSNYDQLGKMLEKHYDNGLRVLLFPCNQFGSQEPGSSDQIKEFACARNPKFDMFEKIKVNGSDTHPLYEYLKKSCPGFLVNAIKWNFTKFLIDRNGNPVTRFGPNEEPNSFAGKVEALLNGN